jgi:hypothetical protein
MTSLLNAERFEAVMADGKKDIVFLRRLTIRQLHRFIEYVTTDQTPELVALCTEKPIEWVDELDLESYATLAEKCVLINFPRATTIADKDLGVAVKLYPYRAKVAALMRQATAGQLTKPSSDAPAPSASAAVNGSGSST